MLELNSVGQWPSRNRIRHPGLPSGLNKKPGAEINKLAPSTKQSHYLELDFPAGNRKAALDITERPVKSDEKTFSRSAPWYPIQQQNLKSFCFVTAAKKQNACNIADCGRYESEHVTDTSPSHRSFPNSQQFFNHRTYFLACLVYRGFDLSHLSNVNQL